MAATSTIRMTKPRISAIVLESTAAVMSAVLLIWLLFWFAHQTSTRQPIEAFAVRGDVVPLEDAPLQAADVRLLSGTFQQVRPSELIELLQGRIRRSGPDMVYISAPVTSAGPSLASSGVPWLKSLVEALCSTPGRDVVLALDLSTIDTERELGVFGNRACWELEEIVNAANAATDEERKPKRRLFILTSAAPAQKSWSADGLGPAQSIFAYYLRKGLEGGDERGPDGDAPRSISLENLHRYVRDHVREWAFRHRGAIQTPMLLAVRPGPEPRPGPKLMTVPAIDRTAAPGPERGQTAATTTSAEPSKDEGREPKPARAAEKAADATDPNTDPKPEDPAKARMKALIAEWEAHDQLIRQRPYHLLPSAWRAYQAALLRTERRLRAAWLDPSAPDVWNRVDLGIEDVRNKSQRISERLERFKNEESRFRFRPVAAPGEDEGKRKLQQALVFLTGQGLDLPELTPPPAPAPKAGPPPGETAKPPDEAPKAPGEAGAAQKEKEPSRKPAPAWLRPNTPETYLELQLPAWAYRFTEVFERRDYFKEDLERRRALLDLVQARADAETALDLDRRGLAWIEPTIERGDALRRKIQDEVLSGAPVDESAARWKSDVEQVGWLYRQARERGQKLREARVIFEGSAQDLPILAEWMVRDQSYKLGAGSPPLQPVPAAVSRALGNFGRLAQLLKEPPPKDQARFDELAEKWFGDLGRAAKETKRDLDQLHHAFRQTINGLASEDRWTTLDAALRAPLIEAKQRALLLEKLRTFTEPPILHLQNAGASASAEGDGAKPDRPADPGFWARAAGLARLDLMLHQLARDPAQLDDSALGPQVLNASWSLLKDGPTSESGERRAAPRFPDFTAAVLEGGEGLGDDLEPSALAGVMPRREEIALKLPDRDRAARLLDAWKLLETRQARSIDQPVEDWAQFSRYDVLDFQFRRLRDDYAEQHVLSELNDGLRETAKALGFAREPAGPRERALQIHTDPERSLKLNDWKGALTIEVPTPSERDELLPPGRAFAGLVVPPGLDVNGDAPRGRIPGQLVHVGASAGAGRPSSRQKFRVEQARYGAAQPFTVKAALFYRGRAGQDAVRAVSVLPNDDVDLISVTIGQDPRVWEQKYGDAARAIEDQFARHQHEGYTHVGKGLDFLLTFRNQTPSRLRVRCEIQLVDPAKPQPKKEEAENWFTDEWTLGPRGADDDARQVSRILPAMGPGPRETRTMKVTLVSLDPQIKTIRKRPFEVVFRQQSIDDYMTFHTEFKGPCHEHEDRGNGPTSCFIVKFTRKADDKFTEPVASSEWRCEMPGHLPQTISAKWIPVDKAYSYHFYNFPFPTNPDCKWSGQVENEEVTGGKNGGKRQPPARPREEAAAPRPAS